MPKKSAARPILRPIDLAERLLADAHAQIEAESHPADLMENLDAAEEIFVLNQRRDRLGAIGEYRPIALLGRGDRASAVAASAPPTSSRSEVNCEVVVVLFALVG